MFFYFWSLPTRPSQLIELKKQKGGVLPTIGTQMVFYEENYKSIYEATKLWKDIGVDYFEIRPVSVKGLDLEISIKPANDKAEVLRLMKMAEELSDDNFKVYAKYGMYAAIMQSVGRNYDECFGSILSGNLGENGDLAVCCHHVLDPNKIFGNINEKSFEEIWTSERRKKILQELNVHKCPPACKHHKLNEILWDYLYPKKENHINFL